MADSFKLDGSYSVLSLGGNPSFAPAIEAPIAEAVTLKAKQLTEMVLDVDTPIAVDFGGVSDAHVVILKVSAGAKVRARITSVDGTQQAVPFDTYMVLMNENSPVTAIDLTRTPATETTVRVFLGEKTA